MQKYCLYNTLFVRTRTIVVSLHSIFFRNNMNCRPNLQSYTRIVWQYSRPWLGKRQERDNNWWKS